MPSPSFDSLIPAVPVSPRTKKHFNVFYSWQSDLPAPTNMLLIRSALNDVQTLLTNQASLDLYVTIDEATKNRSGSPNIADSIFQKIRAADVFVCDLTKVSEEKHSDRPNRIFCNPNVAIELGYAIRVLGWDRIIIAFNEAHGIVPEDLPFDVRGHRASKFTCATELNDKGNPTLACEQSIKNARGSLKKLLFEALKLVAESEPKRPRDLEEKQPDELRRERDVEQLREILMQIPAGVLDHFVDRLGYCSIPTIGTDFFESFQSVVKSFRFHLNNPALNGLVWSLYKAWSRSLKFSDEMDMRRNNKELYFDMPGDVERTHRQGRLSKRLPMTARPLNHAIKGLFSYVRKNYVEIDVNEVEKQALARYRANNP